MEDEKTLLKKLHEGSMDSFKWIYEHYYRLMCCYAYSFTRDKRSAEEIVDDVMFSLWDHHEHVVVSQIRPYLFRAIRNLCINYRKSAAIRFHSAANISMKEDEEFLDSIFNDDEHPLGLLLEKELENYLARAIEELPDECRRVFIMNRNENKTYEEIAEQLGLSVNTVKYHMKNALRILTDKMSRYLMFVVTFL